MYKRCKTNPSIGERFTGNLGAYCYEWAIFSYLAGVYTVLLYLEACSMGVFAGDFIGESTIAEDGFWVWLTFYTGGWITLW